MCEADVHALIRIKLHPYSPSLWGRESVALNVLEDATFTWLRHSPREAAARL